MATEILHVQEEHLHDVIRVLRIGLGHTIAAKIRIDPEVRRQLKKWCLEEERYLRRMYGKAMKPSGTTDGG